MAESITTLCQTGNLEAAYRQASASLAERPDSQFAQNDMFTVVLACLKKYGGQADVGSTTRWVRKLAALRLPGVVWRDEQLCWEMHNLLRVLFKRQYPPHAEIAELLLALVGLPLVAVASVGRSRLLQAALKFREQLPATWWDWWNLELLRPEDFVKESYTPAGAGKAIRLPALAESAYGSYAKGLLKSLTAGAGSAPDAIAAAEALLPKMEALAADHADYSWLGYHRAKLLVALGDTAAALPTLLQIVRQKSAEYWAWQLLGETLRPTDAGAALACYYRAAQCPADEMYLGRLRETLAGMLHAAGHLGEAQRQLRLLAQARQSEGKSLPTAAGQLASQQWFSQAYPPDKTIAATLLATAEEAAYGDLPWQSVALQHIGDEQPDKPALAWLLPMGESARPLSVPLKKYRWLSKLPVGTPLQVKCESVAGRLKVVLLQKRPAGTLWDVVPAQVVVVTNLSPDKARAFFTAAPGQYGAIQLAEANLGSIQPGDSLQVRLQTREKDGVSRHTVLTAEPTRAAAPASVCRDFKGRLRMHEKGFGFADNIFLPPHLITQWGLVEGAEVSGRAVLTHNRAKSKEEWSVLKID
jgi:hypothetical protein